MQPESQAHGAGRADCLAEAASELEETGGLPKGPNSVSDGYDRLSRTTET